MGFKSKQSRESFVFAEVIFGSKDVLHNNLCLFVFEKRVVLETVIKLMIAPMNSYFVRNKYLCVSGSVVLRNYAVCYFFFSLAACMLAGVTVENVAL